jgi:hypothetical protein
MILGGVLTKPVLGPSATSLRLLPTIDQSTTGLALVGRF